MSNRPLIRNWEEMTHSDFVALDLERTVVLLTCAPLEVHGPHLPVVADIAEGDALLRAGAAKIAEARPELSFVRLPNLFVAADVLPRIGSVSFSPSTVEQVLKDLGKSLAVDWFRHLWVSNFHGGPRHLLSLEKAAHHCWRKHGLNMVSLFSLMVGELADNYEMSEVLGGIPGLSRESLAGDVHAGVVETSILLHLRPELVDPQYKDLDRLSVATYIEARNGRARSDKTVGEMFENFMGIFDYFYEETYSGMPAAADAEIGAAIVEILAEKSKVRLLELLDGVITPGDCHSHLWSKRGIFLNGMVDTLLERMHKKRRADRIELPARSAWGSPRPTPAV